MFDARWNSYVVGEQFEMEPSVNWQVAARGEGKGWTAQLQGGY
jgi:hypothetical protein